MIVLAFLLGFGAGLLVAALGLGVLMWQVSGRNLHDEQKWEDEVSEVGNDGREVI